jgi:polar amino acid transport system substrate-binding protein
VLHLHNFDLGVLGGSISFLDLILLGRFKSRFCFQPSRAINAINSNPCLETDTMLMRKLLFFVVLVAALLPILSMPTMQAQDAPPLRVVVKPLEPFVMGSGSDLSGFSIDLWRELAQHLQVDYEFIEVESVAEQLAAVENGSANIAIAGISITAAREELIDFSYPYFNSGLQIMVRRTSELTIEQIMSNLLAPGILQIIAVFCLVILTGGHLIWLIERRSNPEFPRSYFRGVVEGMWWSSILVVTGNLTEKPPVTALSRLISLVWLFIGVLLIANFTASVTAIATINHFENTIAGVNDLSGRHVMTVAGSTTETYLKQIGITPQTVTTIGDAYPVLERGSVDAIVYDAPVLNYYAARGGSGKVEVLGAIFNLEDYGIALPNNSPLRESINRALLALKEDGTYDRIDQFWFSGAV